MEQTKKDIRTLDEVDMVRVGNFHSNNIKKKIIENHMKYTNLEQIIFAGTIFKSKSTYYHNRSLEV